MKPQSGARRALIGTVWLSGSGYIGFVLNLGVTLVLARILFPKDFGQFALAGSFVDLLSIITAFSFSQGIIQMPTAPQVAETAYVLSRRLYWGMLAVAAVLCVILSPHYPGSFIPLFFILFAVRNLTLFSYVYSAQLEKQLVYHQLSVVRLVTAVLAMVVDAGDGQAPAPGCGACSVGKSCSPVPRSWAIASRAAGATTAVTTTRPRSGCGGSGGRCS